MSEHIPVLRDEVIEVLSASKASDATKNVPVYVDGTFGAGGYSAALLARGGVVVAIDRDSHAIDAGAALRAAHGGRLHLIEGRFSAMDAHILACGFDGADGVCLDIGVSSMQLDDAARGFSFMRAGPLDMRMSGSGMSAEDIVNDYDEDVLARIIAVFGEERRARAIARAISKARKLGRLTCTDELADLVKRAVGGAPHPHPATRTFQALRIYLNDELGELIKGLHAAEAILRPNACLAVVSFHSLEDRIVKRFLTMRCGRQGRGSRHMPEQITAPPSFTHPLRMTPSRDEIARNPRARSARLRAAYRSDASPMSPASADMLLPARAGQLYEQLADQMSGARL